MKLTIGILSYNTKELLRRCLKTIFKYTKDISFEVIVVDNASKDGSCEMIKKEFTEIKLIKNRKNNYFAKGYNQIIKIACGEYFIMLNSDTYLVNNSFKKIISFMEEKNISASEGLEIRPNGKIIATGSLFRPILCDFYELSFLGRIFRNRKFVKRIRMTEKNRKKNYEVDVGCNAYFCIKTSLLKAIGGFDKNFTLYYTEDDICRRVKEKGYKIFHCGESYVFHEDAKSTMQLGNKRIDIFYQDMLYYHKKYSGILKAYALFLLLSLEKHILRIMKILT